MGQALGSFNEPLKVLTLCVFFHFSQELYHPGLYKGESFRKRKSFNKCWGVGRRFRLVFRPRAVARGRQRFRVGFLFMIISLSDARKT